MQSAQPAVNDSYSLETLVRYAFNYEVQNKLQTNPDTESDPKLQAVLDYMQARIQEIAQKYK